MQSVIYKIKSIIQPDRIYIGSAVNYDKRRWEHIRELKRNRHHSVLLQRHFNKYGASDLKFEILMHVNNVNLLISEEQKYIDLHNPFFNICRKAGSSLGFKHSEESKKKMSLARKGIKRSPMTQEQKEKLRNAHIGKKATRETKEKMRIKKSGKNNVMFGKQHSEQAKEKMSQAKLGKTASEKTKEKMSESHRNIRPIWNEKKLIDTNTKEIFPSIKEAAFLNNINRNTLSAFVTGRNPNKTNLIYYTEDRNYRQI